MQNVKNAWAAGFTHVGVYMFPVRAQDPATQARELISLLAQYDVQYDSVMLDIEGDDWAKYTQVR